MDDDDFLYKITVFQSLCYPARTRTKVLVVHSLSPAAEDGEDDDLGVSDDSGDMKSRKESSEDAKHLFFVKIRSRIKSKFWSCSRLQSNMAFILTCQALTPYQN